MSRRPPVPPAVATGLAVRRARPGDVPAISGIVNAWAALGRMLPREEAEVGRTLSDFFVAVEGEEVVGCGALALYGHDLAEVRSLAVRADRQGRGIGASLVRSLLAEADAYEIPSVISFTYVPDFFARFGFRVVPADTLPRKAWTDCVKCPKRNFCDEVAMERRLPDAPVAFPGL